MTELAIHRPGQVEHFDPRPEFDRPMRLVEWAEEARAAHVLAQSLCKTPFAGQYQNNELGATAAILKGAEVGLTPVTALGAFDLIQGTPAPKAITLRALVQSRGHSVWIEKSTDTECVAKARRRGESEVHESKWTTQRAQKLGLTNKPNWKNQPQAMLVARATSEVCRMVAADVILGIGYSAEEVLDAEPEPTVTVQRQPKRTAQRTQPEPPPVREPDLEPEAPEAERPAEPAPAPDAPGITQAQSRKMHALFNEHGVTDRDARLSMVAALIGREVSSSSDLSKAEAGRVIDALESQDPEPTLDVEP